MEYFIGRLGGFLIYDSVQFILWVFHITVWWIATEWYSQFSLCFELIVILNEIVYNGIQKFDGGVEVEDTCEKIDIVKLNAEIEEIVKREDELREAIRNIIEEIEVGI